MPKDISNLLFYIQRTVNINTIVYELNLNGKGEPDVEEPIKIYWIKYAQKGEKVALSYLQRKFAYGVKTKLIDSARKTFAVTFNAYKKKQFQLMKTSQDNKYHMVDKDGNLVKSLSNVYVEMQDGTFWMPDIKFVNVTSKDLTTGKEVVEKIIP